MSIPGLEIKADHYTIRDCEISSNHGHGIYITNIPDLDHEMREQVRARMRSMPDVELTDHLRMCRLSIEVAREMGIELP